ncbi:hypothetical protein THAOC_22781 [Thalassiosira oceanica]|uniref:Uncharacterized protein n=1 Tax=Thalassiosira oceanica TaxID=159749 RepID=K0RTR4_THAOC|nr:hypothetical protein THAOC_22781 [Thalassiosira oceanica]|eukprot:EJK57203.1 hypothetical protein THAOC_22781 [Thalassiosira oceanica]
MYPLHRVAPICGGEEPERVASMEELYQRPHIDLRCRTNKFCGKFLVSISAVCNSVLMGCMSMRPFRTCSRKW